MTSHFPSALRVAAGLLAVVAFAASAQIPQTLSLQGQLATSAGAPVNATLPMTFSLWDAPSAGTQLWTENHSVTVTAGLYSVILGSVTPVGMAFDRPYYLQVQVGADAPMEPRRPLASLPYARNAANATCEAGDLMPCYSGPAGTLNMGICKAGYRACDVVTRTFGACSGQVLPAVEVTDGYDNNCDGIVDNP